MLLEILAKAKAYFGVKLPIQVETYGTILIWSEMFIFSAGFNAILNFGLQTLIVYIIYSILTQFSSACFSYQKISTIKTSKIKRKQTVEINRGHRNFDEFLQFSPWSVNLPLQFGQKCHSVSYRLSLVQVIKVLGQIKRASRIWIVFVKISIWYRLSVQNVTLKLHCKRWKGVFSSQNQISCFNQHKWVHDK